MTLTGNKSRLVGLTKELSIQWEQTKHYWADAKALEFERRFLDPLWVEVDRTVAVIEKLDELLKKVRSDCE
jgi:hypothetical protein